MHGLDPHTGCPRHGAPAAVGDGHAQKRGLRELHGEAGGGAVLSDAGSTGIDPADCTALDGTVTVLASDGPVELSAALTDTADAPDSGSLSGVTVSPRARRSQGGP
ncbi:hypothetical protein OG713_45935 (plasmid) [Streptomyces sp. NBC_00723]|uniref:hypothetical protein n=1 Tax=Streptomyces sp. NBC_00723 TaxID=2903673 RepID=UPI002F910BF3